MENLLPAVWDWQYAYGMPRSPMAPDQDMPKASRNKANGNEHFALIADIKSGWRNADLTLKERRAIFMRYGLDRTQVAIGAHEGVTKQTIDVRLYTGVGKIVAELNGSAFTEEEALDQ